MDKVIWKLTGEGLYFLGNVLLRVKVVFLPNYPLVLSLYKHRGVRDFLNKKNEDFKQEKPLKIKQSRVY